METRYLKTLVVAVESGSFSKAAEILHLTQSAVSQRVKFLEERYGHQLIDRSGQVLVPTEVGQLVLEKARSVLEKENELLEGLRRFEDEKRLSLGCTPSFGSAFLPVILNRFMQQNTHIADLKFLFHQPDDAVKALTKGEIDLAIIDHCEGFDLADFKTYSLPQDELVLLSAPKLGLPGGTLDVERLLLFSIYCRKEGCSSTQLFKQNLASLDKNFSDFKGVVVSDDIQWVVDNVLAGRGIAFLSKSVAKKHLEQGDLHANHVHGFNHLRARTVAFLPQRAKEPIVSEFLNCVQTYFSQNELECGKELSDVQG